jgi:hypothetical protein
MIQRKKNLSCLFIGGIQFATAQLPLLQLMDCGMTLCASLQNEKQGPYFGEINGAIRFCPKLPTSKKQSTNQKLIIKHGNLKKLSLWGCSAIDALYLNCPELNDLNLNSCTNLNPGLMSFPLFFMLLSMLIVAIVINHLNILRRTVASSVSKIKECACIWLS